MNHIEVALSVLKEEISKLNRELKYGKNLPHEEEEITQKMQKLHRAVNDIAGKFDM